VGQFCPDFPALIFLLFPFDNYAGNPVKKRTVEDIMKMLRITFFAAAALVCSTQAYAVIYLARPYEPNMARWLTRDPIGERGGPNLYCFVANSPVSSVDPLGLQPPTGSGPWGPGIGCWTCRCKSVDVTYEPGGDALQLGPYREPLLGFPWYYNFGSAVHVHWNVEGGAPHQCKYYQDEKGTSLTWQMLPNGASGTVIGVDGHQAPYEYTDYMGNTFGSPLGTDSKGTYKMVVHWNVTFRCESAPGSGGGTVSRTDRFDREATFTVPWW
jgi:RHS repeat-associated protein